MSEKKITGIFLFLGLLGAICSFAFLRLFTLISQPGIDPSTDVLFRIAIIPLSLIAILSLLFACFLGYILIVGGIYELKKGALARLGEKTVGYIKSSARCDDDGDTCMCGTYTFKDLYGIQHIGKFKTCIHWPSHEQWKLVMQTHSLEASNTVYYFRYLPFIHKMDFPNIPIETLAPEQ